MDCETCNDLLLDLAYGELDEVREAAVRKHVDGCAECRGALARIERGRRLARELPRENAPPISAALREAIEAGVSGVAASASVIPFARSDRRVSRWFERVGEFAMRRQVAMAAVFLLMIGVGLIFYQTHPRPSETPDVRTPDVVPAVEVSNDPNGASTRSAALPHTPAIVHPTADYRDERARFVAPATAGAHGSSYAAITQARATPPSAPARETATSANIASADSEQAQAAETAHLQASLEQQSNATSTPIAGRVAIRQGANLNTVAIDGTTNLPTDSTAGNGLAGSATRTGIPTPTVGVANNFAVNSAGIAHAATIPELQAQLAAAHDQPTRNRISFELATQMERAGRDEDARAYLQAIRGTADEQGRADAEIAQINRRIQLRNAQVAAAQVAASPAAAAPPRPSTPPAAATNVTTNGNVYPGSSGSESNSNSSIRRGTMRRAVHHSAQPSAPTGYDADMGL